MVQKTVASQNMSATWAGQLYSFVSLSLEKLGQLPVEYSITKSSRPDELLLTLSEVGMLVAEQHLRNLSTHQQCEGRIGLSPRILDQLTSLSPELWTQLKLSKEESKSADFSADFEEKNLVKRLDCLRRIRNEFGRGEATFPNWVDNFMERSQRWTEILDGRQLPIPFPKEFEDWLKSANYLSAQWVKIEPSWAEWSAQIDDAEKQLSHDLDALNKQRAIHRKLRNIANELEAFFTHRPDARSAFAIAQNVADFLGKLHGTTSTENQSHSDLQQQVDTFVAACRFWADFEKKVANDEEYRKTPEQADVLHRIENLRQLREAVQTEGGTGVNARLARLQQEAVDSALAPIQDFLNETANQFRIFDNILPIRLERFANRRQGDRLGFRVGQPPREVSQTSSGQRSQLGLLTFLALHYGLRDTYASKVLCLDEVTSSFDLAQVPRLALLLRQIAYGSVDSPFRRQVFIASHNEEFSQRLAELLTPPKGNTLRILRFTGYDSSGPVIQSHTIQPALPFDSKRLKSYFNYRYGNENG